MKEITLEEAQKFIKRWGMSSDLYITQNIEYDMNGGDPTDNSIKLSNEHEEMLHKVVEAGMKANSGAGVSYKENAGHIKVGFAESVWLNLDVKGDIQKSYPMWADDWKKHLKNFVTDLNKALNGKRISDLG